MSRASLAFLLLGTLLLLLPGPPVPAGGREIRTRGEPYIGSERCRSCHPAQFAQWSSTPHARAHLSLPPERRDDVKCTGCHTPDPGGLFAAVQCESCHGPGRHYAFDFVMKDAALARRLGLRDPGESVCRGCHQADGVRGPFDFATKVRSVVHRSR